MDMDYLYHQLLDTYRKGDDYHKNVEKVAEIVKKTSYTLQKDEMLETYGYIPYPAYDDAKFNERIFAKKEFNIKEQNILSKTDAKMDYDAYSRSKCPATSQESIFQLTQNQRFIKNFLSPLTPYNGLLLFHSVGVGKTCTAISIAEQYQQLYKKPVLVILSHTLIDNFKKQIFDVTKYDIVNHQSNQCTGTTYPDMILDKNMLKPDVLDKAIAKIINRNYKFIGYKKLVSIFNQTMEKVKKQEKDASKHDAAFYAKIKEYFSDRLIIIDEAHNLRNSSEKGTKQTAQTFWQLLKHTENVKLVLLTATPMFNSSTEIVWLMNLMLTNDKRKNIKVSDVFDKSGNLTPSGKKLLIDTSRGYVSYMRGENPFTFPFRLYPSINADKKLIKQFPVLDYTRKKIHDDDKIKFLDIVGSDMSGYQKSVYDIFKKRISVVDDDAMDNIDDIVDDGGDVAGDNDEASNDLRSIVQISNVVYPIDDIKDANELKKAYGKSGFENTFVNTSSKGLKLKYSNQCLSKFGEIFAYENLPKYAPKIKSVIDYILKSEGIVFVYSNYYPSGIKPLAIALEHIGFNKYNASNITEGNITVSNKVGNKRPSYVVISRNNDLSPNNDREIDIVKSKDNADGSVIKVVIASQIASEGIDFKRIREVHILEPWYNLNRSEQIIGRAVRTCSHIDLPKEKRNVTIYFHACQYDQNEESIDLRTYRIAEKKQRKITEVEKVLKETSIDCNLNKKNLLYHVNDINVSFAIRTSQGVAVDKYRVGDRDFSYVCNYEKCKLTCNPDLDVHNNKRGTLDDTTFDVRFIMDDIALYKRYIAGLFQGRRKALTYERILSELLSTYKNIEEEPLQYALQDMLDDKTQIFDHHGIRGYLIYKSNKYLFQSFMNNDRKMTIEQREEPLKMGQRAKLDLSVLKTKTVTEVGNTKISTLDSNLSYIGSNDPIAYVKTKHDKIVNGFAEMGVNVQSYSKYIVDSIIDRLTKVDYIRFMETICTLNNSEQIKSDFEKSCLRSIVEGSVVIVNDNNKIRHFYNYYDGEVYCLRDDKTFKKCSPLEYSKISSAANELKKKMTNELADTIKGHLEGGEGCEFKVRDNPKSSGYVCWKTSSLSLNDLKDRIKAKEPLFNLDIVIKRDMCLLYEVILRSQGKKVFKRSIVKKLK
jgi:hypothetical protein